MAKEAAKSDNTYLWLTIAFMVVGIALLLFGISENNVALRYAEVSQAHGGGNGYLLMGTGLVAAGSSFLTLFLTRRG